VNNVVQLVPVTVRRDFGTSLEVSGALEAGDQVIVNPAESIAEGLAVRATGRGGAPVAK
jgi:hypothetical protein